jgi:hypothetical protein
MTCRFPVRFRGSNESNRTAIIPLVAQASGFKDLQLQHLQRTSSGTKIRLAGGAGAYSSHKPPQAHSSEKRQVKCRPTSLHLSQDFLLLASWHGEGSRKSDSDAHRRPRHEAMHLFDTLLHVALLASMSALFALASFVHVRCLMVPNRVHRSQACEEWVHVISYLAYSDAPITPHLAFTPVPKRKVSSLYGRRCPAPIASPEEIQLRRYIAGTACQVCDYGPHETRVSHTRERGT